MIKVTYLCPKCQTRFRVNLEKPVIGAICPKCDERVIVRAETAGVPAGYFEPATSAKSGRRLWLRILIVLVLIGAVAGGAIFAIKNGYVPFFATDNDSKSKNSKSPGEVKATTANINRAVENGVAYLKKRLRSESFATPYAYWRGGKSGTAALAGLTLLACGVSKTDAAVERAAEIVRKESLQQRFTYGLSLSYLFLTRLHDPADEPIRRRLILRLAAGKNRDGLWGYWCPVLTKAEEKAVLADLKKGVPIHGHSGDDTRSASEFAMMALWTARQQGLPVDGLLRSAADQFRIAQQKNGSWNYIRGGGDTSNDSMTCAGLRALAIGHALKHTAGDARSDPNIDRGIGYLGGRMGRLKRVTDAERSRRKAAAKEFVDLIGKTDRTKKEEDRLNELLQDNSASKGAWVDSKSWGDLHFLWSMQRTATTFGVRKLGQLDWYQWGAPLILENQSNDGAWREVFPGIPDTCFALLFLKRADLFDGLNNMLENRLQLMQAGE